MSEKLPYMVFSGTKSKYLAEKICAELGCPLGKLLFTKFADGEFAISYEESIRGRDIFLVQSTFPNSDNLMELLLMIDAAKRASARNIIAVIPYFGWARQDRKDRPRVSIGAKLVADLLSVAGIDRMITMDLHADQEQGFFNVPVDHLYALAAADDAGGSRGLELGLVHLVAVVHRHAQAGGAAVHVANVGGASKAGRDLHGALVALGGVGRGAHLLALLAGVVVGLGVELGLGIALLAAGRCKVELLDEEGEQRKVHGKERKAERDDEHPARLIVALQDAEHKEVEQAAGEREADGDVQKVAEHIRETGKNGGDAKEHRRHEQERELKRLGDASEGRRQRGREQKTAHRLLALGLGGLVHSERRAREREDVEHELAGEAPGAGGGEMGDGGVGQLREEDVLGAVDHLAGNLHGAANGGLPEGQVKHVVQAKGDEQALDHAKQEHADGSGACHRVAERVDARLDRLPYEEHGDAHEGEHHGGDDGYKARPTEERERLRQLDLVEPGMQRRGAEAHDDAAKGAHLERRDAKDARRRAVHELLHAAGEVDHGRDGGMHNEKRHARGESRDLLLGARHADRHADGKDERQVVKDDAAARGEHREDVPGDGAGSHDA